MQVRFGLSFCEREAGLRTEQLRCELCALSSGHLFSLLLALAEELL